MLAAPLSAASMKALQLSGYPVWSTAEGHKEPTSTFLNYEELERSCSLPAGCSLKSSNKLS